MLNKNEVERQSTAAWNTWKTKWKNNCHKTRFIPKTSFTTLLGRGKGKTLVQAAFGASLAKHLPTLQANRHRFDLMCCDKAFGFLVKNGITPDYCMLADASVSSDWIGEADTSKTILVANIAANPDWTVRWKGEVVFYANYDNIGSAKVLAPIADVYELIPASSNVSNAQVVFAAQVLGYESQLLVGYDYSWRADGNYYASGDNPKRYYMHHMEVVSPYGYIAQTSSNLYFSSSWLQQFLAKFPLTKVFNCSGEGILTTIPTRGFLEVLNQREKQSRTSKGIQ